MALFKKIDTSVRVFLVLAAVAIAGVGVAEWRAASSPDAGRFRVALVGAARIPLVIVSGQTEQLPAADYVSSVGGLTVNATPPTAAGDIETTTLEVASTSSFGGQSTFKGQITSPSPVGASTERFGAGALASNTGADNTAVGNSALNANTSGVFNTAVGFQSLLLNLTSCCGVAIGYQALAGGGGNANTAVGYVALTSNAGGIQNVAVGAQAMQNNLTGNSNVAIGDNALNANIVGVTNTAIGQSAAVNNLADNNVAIGFNSLFTNTTGTLNTALGIGACEFTNSDNNVCIGYRDMVAATNGTSNTAVGTYGLRALTNGSNNTSIGYQAGNGITTGANNTIIGANATASMLPAGLSNAIIIGDGSDNLLWMSALAPMSVSHGTLGGGSVNTIGNVTGVAATTVVLTFSGTPFPNHAWCQVTENTDTITSQYIRVTNSITAPTFSCFLAGVASNCNDFSYRCDGD